MPVAEPEPEVLPGERPLIDPTHPETNPDTQRPDRLPTPFRPKRLPRYGEPDQN